MGEGCGFTRAELDALCELGAEKLELGLIQESITVLRGLVALYPYSPKYYLCLGLALMKGEQFGAAASSLELAATLSPHDPIILLYLIEAQLRCGQLTQAQKTADLFLVPENLSDSLQSRWQLIQRCLEQLKSKPEITKTSLAQPKEPTPKPQRAPVTFKLPNGKSLPLEKSSYEVTQPWIPISETEKTQTDTPLMTFDESITITAVVRRRKPIRPAASQDSEVTQTAVVVRRNITRENRDDTAVAYFSDIDQEV